MDRAERLRVAEGSFRRVNRREPGGRHQAQALHLRHRLNNRRIIVPNPRPVHPLVDRPLAQRLLRRPVQDLWASLPFEPGVFVQAPTPNTEP